MGALLLVELPRHGKLFVTLVETRLSTALLLVLLSVYDKFSVTFGGDQVVCNVCTLHLASYWVAVVSFRV